MDQHCETVVVGAGITGLVAGWILARHGHDVCVVEASPRAGGLVRSSQRGGFLLEHGPFTVLPKSPVFRRILAWSGEELQVVTADARAKARRYVLQRGKLVGINGRLGPMTTRLYGWRDKGRLLRGLVWSRRGPGSETTIEEAATRRFGSAFARWAVNPLIRGIVAGDIADLSLDAVFPHAARLDRRIRSPLAAIARRPATSRRAAAPSLLDELLPRLERHGTELPRRAMISFRHGLGVLTEWLARQLGERVRLGHPVVAIDRVAPAGLLCVTIGSPGASDTSGAARRSITCRQVVVTLPAHRTADVVEPLLPDGVSILRQIDAASLAVVHLGFDRRTLRHLPDGFGFLVPTFDERVPVMGTLFASRTFPHHAPAGGELLRVFVGGAADPEAVSLAEETIVERALDGIGQVLGVAGRPELVEVDRFRQAIPQYRLGHLETIRRLDQCVARHPGLILAGSYRGGVSVNDRIDAGYLAAVEVLTGSARSADRPSS